MSYFFVHILKAPDLALFNRDIFFKKILSFEINGSVLSFVTDMAIDLWTFLLK